MRGTGLVVLVAVISSIILLSACVSSPSAQQAVELKEVPNTEKATEVPLQQWMYYNATWDGNNYFASTPSIDANGYVTATRSDASDNVNTWKAQLIRFYPKNYQKYYIKLLIKANKSATIKAYFGADPYIEELASAKDVEVSTTEREVVLEFGPKDYTGAKFLKFSLEFAHVPGLQLQVKVIDEKFE